MNADGRGLQSCFRTLKSVRLSSLPSIGSIRAGIQIDLGLVGFPLLWRPVQSVPKPRIEQPRGSGPRPPKNTLLFGGKLLPKFFQKIFLQSILRE